MSKKTFCKFRQRSREIFCKMSNAFVKLGDGGIFLQQKTQNDPKKFHGKYDAC